MIKFSKLPPLERLEVKQLNQVVPQLTQRGRSFKHQFAISPSGTFRFRRKSCTCQECGGITIFQEKQNALHPVTYIRAHHVKKRKRKMHRNKGHGARQFSAKIERHPPKIEDISKLIPSRKERKAKTLLQNYFIEKTIQKCKRLLTKDDAEVSYDYFFANQLKLAFIQTQEFLTTSTFEKTPTQLQQQQNGALSSQRTIDESQIASIKNLNINQSQLINTQLPQIINKNKQKPSLHSPRVYQDILQTHNLKPNKTVNKYISQSTHSSPKRGNFKLPTISQKKQPIIQRKKSEHIYIGGSPLKLLLELKTQILLQKKMSKQ